MTRYICILAILLIASSSWWRGASAAQCQEVAVLDSPCNDEAGPATALVPLPSGESGITCEVASATCYRFVAEGDPCVETSCQTYLRAVQFSGWRIGIDGTAQTCTQVCEGIGGPTGCSTENSGTLTGLQNTVNIYNLLGRYDELYAKPTRLTAVSSISPAYAVTTDTSATIRYRTASESTSCSAGRTNIVCCCSENAAYCQIPSDPSYNVPWP